MSGTESLPAAFTKEENDILTQVSAGTPMGNLFRQYWIPVIFPTDLSDEQPQKRVRLLGEDLVVFKTKAGNYGLVGEFCSHRLASLYFGRVEGEAIRCLYHGWLYSTDGTCIAQGNLSEDQQFCERIKHPGYRCVVHGGVVWAYMGPNEELPPLPEFGWTLVPAEQRAVDKTYLDCNYLQAIEGGIDPTHALWLHAPIDIHDEETAQEQGAGQRLGNSTGKRNADTIEVHEYESGFMYGVRRDMPDGRTLWRTNQWIIPFYTMPPGDYQRTGRMYIPVDDEHVIRWNTEFFPTREELEASTGQLDKRLNYGSIRPGWGRPPEWVGGFLPETSEPYGDIRKVFNRGNDYNIDWEKHYTKRMGVPGVSLQDISLVENEGPGKVMDRSKENLCAADVTTVMCRRQLLRAAKALQEKGEAPIGARDGSVYNVRGSSILCPGGTDLLEGLAAHPDQDLKSLYAV